ncbi:MAG: 6-phosphogluconolactonase [Ignavibacteriae bacterium]|nr:MAG: 6-phosphogluconolactonase [Ignavibacteriota bacterium]
MISNPLSVKILKTRSDLEKFTSHEIIEVIRKSVKEKSRCSIALSGGETPKNVYRQMGLDAAMSHADWSRVHIFFCDERSVPPAHPDSNYGMADRVWFSRSAFPHENIHRIKGEIEPHSAAREYELEIKKYFGSNPVVFDFILLGVGEDGHTASLFPGSEAAAEKQALVSAVPVQSLNSWRVTMTFPVLNNARDIMILAAGSRKANVIQRILDASAPDLKLPAAGIRPGKGTVQWMIDEEAGSLLKDHSGILIKRISLTE